MAYREPPSEADFEQLRALCEANPEASAKAIASMWGRNPITTGKYIKRLRLGRSRARALERNLQCPEPLRQIFAELDAQGKSMRQQARELGIGTQTLGRYRRGEQSPSFYLVICLAQMARIELRAEKEAA